MLPAQPVAFSTTGKDSLDAYSLSDYGPRQPERDIQLGAVAIQAATRTTMSRIWVVTSRRVALAYSALNQARPALGFRSLWFAVWQHHQHYGIGQRASGSSKVFDNGAGYHSPTAPTIDVDVHQRAAGREHSGRAADTEFRVALVDTGVVGADLAGAQYVPIPIDVRSVRQVTLNGTREDLGDGETWRFDRARQKLIQDPGATALTAADALVVDYTAQAVIQASNPAAAVMRDDFADLPDSEGLAFGDALATAAAFLDRYGTLTDRLSVEIRDNAASAREAETVQFDTAMLRALGLTDAADADRWLMYDVESRWDGDVRLQRVECQRGEFRERAVDWWRERGGDA